jgi:hypothetical protein
MKTLYWNKGIKNSEYVRCNCCHKSNRLKVDIKTNLSIFPNVDKYGRYINTVIHFYNGLVFNNKLCCILYFCNLSFRGLRPAIVSGYIRGEGHKWFNSKLTEDEIDYIHSSL